MASIRILSPNDFSNWRIIQDYRERSVLKGFAVVGGLWTFLCGVFAMIFGPSLMQILFGMSSSFGLPLWHLCLTWNLDVKPLSVFGLIHRLFERERQPLFNQYNRNEKGFSAFMANCVTDFGPLESSPVPPGPVTSAQGCHDCSLTESCSDLSRAD